MTVSFDYQSLSLETESLSLAYFEVPWDSELLSRPVAQIESIRVHKTRGANADFQEFLQWQALHGIQFSSCRIDQSQLLESRLLQSSGYRFIELNYKPEINLDISQLMGNAEFQFLDAQDEDQDSLIAMAGSTFQHGRFHDDPEIGAQIGNLRYAQWMRNAFYVPHQNVVKCVLGGATIAFFVEERNRDHVFWSLVGLAPGLAGKGMGKRVWRAYLDSLSAQGIKRVSTSISTHNVAVFNLYVSLGFRFPPPTITFHWHATASTG